MTLARPPPRPGTHSLSRTSFRGSAATEESPGWFRRGNDNGAEITLSFSRFARESPCWLLKGNDVVLLCPCVVAKYAQLRFRLAAKASPAPLLLLFGRDPLRWVRVRGEGWGFHGVLRTPLNDREFEFPRPLLGVCPSVWDPRFARMTEEGVTLPRPRRTHASLNYI